MKKNNLQTLFSFDNPKNNEESAGFIGGVFVILAKDCLTKYCLIKQGIFRFATLKNAVCGQDLAKGSNISQKLDNIKRYGRIHLANNCIIYNIFIKVVSSREPCLIKQNLAKASNKIRRGFF